jgi:hypothetical protein
VGTSKSYDGPKDRTPLLPPWAFPNPNEEVELPEDLPEEIPPQSLDNLPLEDPEKVLLAWRSAKTSLGQIVPRQGNRGSLCQAGQRYVRALGGSRKAAIHARAGRSATAGLSQFLSNVSSRGIGEALQSLGLSQFIGKSAELVFAAISNALAPAGASREEVIARQAINEALECLYEQHILEDGDIAKLDQLETHAIEKAIEVSVSAYIYHRWLAELEIALERRTISAKEAVRLEREVKKFVRECVQLDFRAIDVLSMDWKGVSGQQFIEKIFADAYSALEGSE